METLMESIQELINALSNGTIPDPVRPPPLQDLGSQLREPQPKKCNRCYLRNG